MAFTHCVVQENIHSIPWKVMGNIEGMEVSKSKNFKGKNEAKLGFLEGWGGGFKQKPFLRRVWIFSATHCK